MRSIRLKKTRRVEAPESLVRTFPSDVGGKGVELA
jgi:hypothetical protein